MQPYLFFEGHCQEALDFCRRAVGAEVTMTTTVFSSCFGMIADRFGVSWTICVAP